MKECIGGITIILAFVGMIPYLIDIFRNKTKPHMFTWIIWAIITLMAFIAQWQQGGGAGSWTTGITGLLTVFTAILSLFKGSKDITKSDVIIFIGALLAIIPWMLTKNPMISVIILTTIDALAFIPTIRKTSKDPKSETLSSYMIHATRHSLSIIALTNYQIATYLFPATLAVMNMIVIGTILTSKRKQAK